MFQDPDASDDDAYDSTSEDADDPGNDSDNDEEPTSSESDVEITGEIQGKDIPEVKSGEGRMVPAPSSPGSTSIFAPGPSAGEAEGSRDSLCLGHGNSRGCECCMQF